MATQNVATKKRRAWTTSVFIKQLMAVSGFVFVFFLLFHSYGNLKMFLGAQVYNDYAHWLQRLSCRSSRTADSSGSSAPPWR